jgi:hypothetical protein
LNLITDFYFRVGTFCVSTVQENLPASQKVGSSQAHISHSGIFFHLKRAFLALKMDAANLIYSCFSGIASLCPSYFKILVTKSLAKIAVLRIRGILVRIRIHGSVPLTNGSDPFCDFKDAKKIFFIFFSTYPQLYFLLS